MTQQSRQSGFVILYAVLLTSVVLGIGIILISIIAKQIQLSSIERSSQAAYYAADAAKQCALLWDQNDDTHNAFGYYSEGVTGGMSYNSPSGLGVNCFSLLPITDFFSSNCTENSTNCKFSINNISTDKALRTCATVDVQKGGASTTIIASGYNQSSCSDESLKMANPRRVQRTVIVNKE